MKRTYPCTPSSDPTPDCHQISQAKSDSDTNAQCEFICSFCGKEFNEIMPWIRHLQIHTEKKPFECGFPGCNKKFRKVKRLEIHFKKEHQKQSENVLNHNKIQSFSQYSEHAKNKPLSPKLNTDTKEESKESILPQFLYTRVLPLPAQVANNVNSMTDLYSFPPLAPKRQLDFSATMLGTYPATPFDSKNPKI